MFQQVVLNQTWSVPLDFQWYIQDVSNEHIVRMFLHLAEAGDWHLAEAGDWHLAEAGD